MAENDNQQNNAGEQQNQAPDQGQAQNPGQDKKAAEPVFQMLRCFMRDASLEMPHAPEIVMQPPKEQPQVDIRFDISQRRLAETIYDITVRGTITVKAGDQAIILVEGKQTGVFEISGLPDEALQHISNVLCPTIIYPYLRANLADLMTRAQVPPVNLPEVNFEMLYQQKLEQARKQAEEAAKKGQPN